MAKTSWPIKTLDEFFDSKPKSSESLRQKDYLSSGKFPVVDQGQELIGGFTNDQQLVRDFEIPVIVFGDHTRCVKYVDFPFASGADGTKILVPRKGVDPKYAYFQLLSIELPTKGYARHFGELSKRSFVLPPLGEQKRIVVLLDAATARVTELTACYEQARTHANNLFTSALCQMFGDVDTKSGTRLGEICIDIVDCEHKTVPIDETGVAWAVGTRAMSGNQIDFSKAKRISSATYSEWTRRMVPKSGDLILAREAPVGPVVQVPESPKVALGQRTVLIRPDTKVVFTLYLHYLLLSEPIQRSMHFKSEGSVVSHLNVKDVRLLPLPMVPPLEEQKRIVAQLDLMQAKTSEMVAAYDAKLTAAKNLRQSILEAAFAGDL